MDQIELLRKVPLLTDLPVNELGYLATTLQTITLAAGEVLFREKEPGESLCIVIKGRLEVLLALGSADEKVMASLGPGEFIGEMSLLRPGGVRTASVRATVSSRLWTMTRLDFEALLHRQPGLVYALVQTLSKRLGATNTTALNDLQEKNRQLQAAYDELKDAQAQIIEKERLERELQVAADIQVSILPQELPQIPGYDFGAIMSPARMVGGDFYDVFFLDETHIGMVVGDVADKGIPSAIFMARSHALIMSEAAHGGTPGEILRRVNTHLITLEQSNQFVTVLLGILDCISGKFDFARAGHELPLLLTLDGTVQTLPQASGQAVGVLDDILLDENTIFLPSGGTLLLFTDGLTDCRSPRGDIFGYERLWAALGRLTQLGGQQVCDALRETLAAYQSGAPQDDDVTLVAVHCSRNP